MNSYIKNQITNMVMMTKTFEQACQMAALEDDGTINKAEDKTLKKLRKATETFRKELEKLK